MYRLFFQGSLTLWVEHILITNFNNQVICVGRSQQMKGLHFSPLNEATSMPKPSQIPSLIWLNSKAAQLLTENS